MYSNHQSFTNPGGDDTYAVHGTEQQHMTSTVIPPPLFSPHPQLLVFPPAQHPQMITMHDGDQPQTWYQADSSPPKLQPRKCIPLPPLYTTSDLTVWLSPYLEYDLKHSLPSMIIWDLRFPDYHYASLNPHRSRLTEQTWKDAPATYPSTRSITIQMPYIDTPVVVVRQDWVRVGDVLEEIYSALVRAAEDVLYGNYASSYVPALFSLSPPGVTRHTTYRGQHRFTDEQIRRQVSALLCGHTRWAGLYASYHEHDVWILKVADDG